MRVPDHLQNGVVFFGYREKPGDEASEKFGGTGFIVGVELGGILFSYLVTADHVARELENYPDPIARINDAHGKAYAARVHTKGKSPYDPWTRHPTDKAADVAVQVFIPIPYGKEFEDERPSISYAPESMFVRDKQFHSKGFGIGDEVFICGLFHFVRGKGSNSPIIRVGNLAMIPNERIYSGPQYGYMDALLIEARSLGRLSGSPVFIRGTVDVARYSGRTKMRRTARRGKAASDNYYLLGLMHGHWDVQAQGLNEPLPQRPQSREVGVNMGVAIVTPAKKILETLYCESLRSERQYFVDEVNKQKEKAAVTLDSGFEPGAQEQFDRTVSALFQVPKDAVKEAEAKRPKRTRKGPLG